MTGSDFCSIRKFLGLMDVLNMPKHGTALFWGGVSALLTRFATSPAVQGGEVGITIVCLASVAIFFVAGFIQAYGQPRRVATMLDMLF